jgi:hypothetical protein
MAGRAAAHRAAWPGVSALMALPRPCPRPCPRALVCPCASRPDRSWARTGSRTAGALWSDPPCGQGVKMAPIFGLLGCLRTAWRSGDDSTGSSGPGLRRLACSQPARAVRSSVQCRNWYLSAPCQVPASSTARVSRVGCSTGSPGGTADRGLAAGRCRRDRCHLHPGRPLRVVVRPAVPHR